MENSIISNLINEFKNADNEFIGIFSWNLRNKVKNVSYQKWNDVIYSNRDYDIYSINPVNFKRKLHYPPSEKHLPRNIHAEIWKPFDLLLEYLSINGIIENKKYLTTKNYYIYSNYFILKYDLYLEFVSSILNPAIELSKNINFINNEVMKPSHEYTLPPRNFINDTGLTSYPLIPFILERLINIFIDKKRLNVGWIL